MLAALALIPLAWLIGEATEHAGAAHRSRHRRLPERDLRERAGADHRAVRRHRGPAKVVRGSLTGSVVGNLLLVLGFSLAFGGRGELDRRRASSDRARRSRRCSSSSRRSRASTATRARRARHLSVIPSVAPARLRRRDVVLLRRHRVMHVADEPPRCAAGPSARSLVVLGVATVVTASSPRSSSARSTSSPRRTRPVGVLRRRRDRRDRRQRRRARRRGRRRPPREDQARRRDRPRLERAGRGLPDPGRRAPLVADRPARALVPAVELAAMRLASSLTAALLRTALEPAEGRDPDRRLRRRRGRVLRRGRR